MAIKRSSKPTLFNHLFLFVFGLLLFGIFLLYISFSQILPQIYTNYERDTFKQTTSSLQIQVSEADYVLGSTVLPDNLLYTLQDFAVASFSTLLFNYNDIHYEITSYGVVSYAPISTFNQDNYERYTLDDLPYVFSYSWPLEVGDVTLNITSVTELSSSVQIQAFLLFYLPLLVFIIILLTTAIAIIYSRIVVRPIQKLNKNAKQMLDLNFDLPDTRFSSLELDELNHTMISLSNKLHTTLDELQAALILKEERELFRKDFLSSISHDLKTPLTAALAQIEILITNAVITDPKYAMYLQETFSVLKDMQNLVQNILTLAYLESTVLELHPERIDFFEIISSLLTVFKSAITNRDIYISIDSNTDEAYFIADLELFKRLLQNIIGNAIQYTPKHGNVTVYFEKTDNLIRISIENSTLEPLSKEDINRIFEPFYRADKSRANTKGIRNNGLGLSISQNILKAHNFSYAIENSEQGVIFKIEIPLGTE